MKALILASMMILGVSAVADTVKTVKVCGYGRHASSNGDCKMMTYKYFTPRTERHCNTNDSGGNERCFDVVVTGNWQAGQIEKKRGGDGGNRDNRGGRKGRDCKGRN